MKQYKLVCYDFEINKKYSNVFSDVLNKKNDLEVYLEKEKKYCDIIFEIISGNDSYHIDLEYIYCEGNVFHDSYNHDENSIIGEILEKKECSKFLVKSNEILTYIKLILREEVSAQILNSDNDEVLFGYISDFESLVYSDYITEEHIKEINKKGFILEEFYFSFDFE
jgi:hypothetical protein